jgi:hypothetical protein
LFVALELQFETGQSAEIAAFGAEADAAATAVKTGKHL